jgi:hypothetical protein
MKSLQQLLSDWRTARSNMTKLQGNIPKIIGNESVRVVKNNFKLQAYDSGTGTTSWPKRKPETDKRYDKRKGVKGSVYNSANPLLTQIRNLYNAVKYYPQGKGVTVGVDLTLIPYAKKMNEGGQGTWGKNKTNTPARKFIPEASEGPNVKILKRVEKKVVSERDKALKDFKK